MLKVVVGKNEYPVEKVIFLEGFKQIPLRPTQDLSITVQLPAEFLTFPNIQKVKRLLEAGKFALVDKIYLCWLYADEELLRKHTQFYDLEDEKVNEYGAYIEKRIIIAVFKGIAYQGEEILRFEIAYPPKLKEVSILEKRSYEVIFKAVFQTKKGEFKAVGGIGRLGDIYWKNIPSPYSEILSQEVQSSAYIEDLIKPYQEVSDE